VVAAVAQQASHTRHQDFEAMNVSRSARSTPQILDQDITRDDLIRMHQQNGKKRTLLRSAERNQPSVVSLDLDRPKNPVIHTTSPERRPTLPRSPVEV
jgi:hypothetical protein